MSHSGTSMIQRCRRSRLLSAPLAWAAVLCLAVGAHQCLALACPDGCTEYGTCYKPLGRCDCPWNRTGPACQTVFEGYCIQRPGVDTCSDDHPTLCLNACNNRGRCLGGFCQCDKGYFGTDCSLSEGPDGQEVILKGLGYTEAASGPKVYVYELPPEYHVKRDIHNVDRPPLHLAIYERLLSSGLRTTSGDEADYYYVPISGRDLKKAFLLKPALDYIATHWPYWNRTQGHRHVIPMEGDVGTCELPLAVRTHTVNSTWLQFWGLYDFHPAWSHIFHNRIPCHVPGRDIVVPFMAMSSHDRFLIETPLRPGRPPTERNLTFFFSGGICGSGRHKLLPPNCTYYKLMRYSGGVRQAMYEHYHGRPGWRVVSGTDSYARDYSTAKFCLAAPGGGWGKRGIVAAMYGCIPVAATDYLYEAFEPEMSWSHFGVRIAQRDIPKLADILESMPPERVTELQKRAACAAQHFHWSSNLGSLQLETGEFDAFATIMAILRMRRKYPDADPASYYELDKEFRDFVDCVPAKREKPLSPVCSMFVGPMYILYPDTCPTAKYYLRRRLGPPGGSVCVGSANLAQCPHIIP